MYKRSTLHLAVLAAISLPAAATADFMEDIEINGYLKNETAIFLRDGPKTGERRTMLDDRQHDAGELMKFENSARFFINGLLGEESSWHLDINLICDSEGVNSYWQCHKNYTQNDWFREAYIDTSVGDLALRLGKQQVVWGTADGIKLLDIINPTDFREMAQNAMEDSRIPIWMINAEMNVGETGNIQFILSENRTNVIPGLTDDRRDSDDGHPFIMKGVDSITGKVNGFLNVTPALAGVAGSFNAAAFAGMFTGGLNASGLLPFAGMTVDGFASNPNIVGYPCSSPGVCGPATSFGPGYIVLNNIAQNGLAAGDPNANNNVTNLMDVYGPQPTQVNWNPANPTSAFEYMPNATFATFNTFNTFDGTRFVGANAVYTKDTPDTYEPNVGFRYRGSLDNGLNFSLNYFYHYSANPEINMYWRDAVTGEKLTVQRATGMSPMPGVIMPDPTTNISPNQIPLDASANPLANPTILLRNSAGQYYGAFDPTTGAFNANQHGVTLVMEESRSRVNSFGASFDYGTQWGDLPVVLRGEFLYDKDEKQPIVDKRLLGVGDLANALVMEDMDRFSYVLGLDVTVFTNLLVSGQFIQMINLDYVDQNRTCTTQTGIQFDCSRYTADFSTVHMTNGMNRGWEYKEFYSLFFSKPFGESQLGRWNNITMYEDGGGWWNRFDVEYSFTDEWIGSAELNVYWGDEDTTFGQFKRSSNAQVGIKYIWGN